MTQTAAQKVSWMTFTKMSYDNLTFALKVRSLQQQKSNLKCHDSISDETQYDRKKFLR